jgi:hypothetical protein
MRDKTFQERYIWQDEQIMNSASIRQFISYINVYFPSSWEKYAGHSGYLNPRRTNSIGILSICQI